MTDHNLLLACQDAPDRPPCYNRPPRAAGTWERTGRTVQTGSRERPGAPVSWGGPPKPVVRFRPTPFADRCATWDGRGIGPNGESFPVAHGWRCDGCRWLPRERAGA